MQGFAEKAFPASKPVIKVFGSLMTGLALQTSDMDMAVTGLAIMDREVMVDYLHELEDQLGAWDLITDMKAIETASIPVIKANVSMKGVAKEMGMPVGDDYEDSELPIDITFDDSPQDGTLGVQTVQNQTNQNDVWHQ